MATDIRLFGAIPDGTTDATAAIQAAINVGDIIIQNGNFLISSSIKIPSNRTIFGKNANLKKADLSYDNFFRNSDFINGNVNIKIIGQGNFCLDGNAVNNYDDNATYGIRTDNTHKYFGIVMGNVDGFEISGINFIDFARWNILLHKAINGTVHDLYFNYATRTENQDGIDILHGCHDITIYNLYGHAGDDFIALFVGNKPDFYAPVSDKYVGDIYNITISNIKTYTTYFHPIIFICGDGNKIHDIAIDYWNVKACSFFVYFGLLGYYTTPPTKDDVYNITFDHVTVLTQANTGAVVQVLNDCKDITFTNFTNSTGKVDYSEAASLNVDNFLINGENKS